MLVHCWSAPASGGQGEGGALGICHRQPYLRRIVGVLIVAPHAQYHPSEPIIRQSSSTRASSPSSRHRNSYATASCAKEERQLEILVSGHERLVRASCLGWVFLRRNDEPAVEVHAGRKGDKHVPVSSSGGHGIRRKFTPVDATVRHLVVVSSRTAKKAHQMDSGERRGVCPGLGARMPG